MLAQGYLCSLAVPEDPLARSPAGPFAVRALDEVVTTMTRVVVVGDLMTDAVARAAFPLVKGSDTAATVTMHGGGSGANIASWMAVEGAEVAFVGRRGADIAGRNRDMELMGYGVDARRQGSHDCPPPGGHRPGAQGADLPTPTSSSLVRRVHAGIRRTIGAAPVRKKAATADITIAMAATGTSLRELRDRAVLLLGFAGAFRRSELVALDVADIEDVPKAS